MEVHQANINNCILMFECDVGITGCGNIENIIIPIFH